MAESFSAALKRYIASGYQAPEAMRAVWHDVKVGRVERPARRRRARAGGDPVAARVLGESRRHPPSSGYGELTGEQHQVLNAWARFGPTHWLRKVKGGWIDELPPIVGSFPTVWKTKREAEARVDRLIQIRSREWRGLEANPRRRRNPLGALAGHAPPSITARAAGRIVRADPAVRRLPRVGWCVRLSDGRELCHDARGYYLVGVQARRTAMKLTARGMNPLTRAETGATLKAIRDSVTAARRLPSMTAPERQDPVARAAHRGWWYGQADAFAQVVRSLGTRRRRPLAYAMRGRRIYYGPGAALRHNPMIIDPVAKLKTLRRIVGEHQAMRIGAEGQVDATTAHAILTVYDALSPANQQKYLAMSVRRMADVAWKLLSKRNPADPSRFLPAGHPVYQTRQRVPKWTVPVSPAHVPKLLRRRLGHFTKAQHEQHAVEHQHRSEVAEDRWQQLVSAATRQYGKHGPLISGVVREHFPEALKRELRRLAGAISEERDVAWAHWKAAGHRTGLATRNPRRSARHGERRWSPSWEGPMYSHERGHTHSLLSEQHTQAMQRAEYYRWSAARGGVLPGGDPLTGRKASPYNETDRDAGRACHKALAHFWLKRAAAIQASMRRGYPRQGVPNPPRWRKGDGAVIADPVRIASRFWSAQHRGIVGAGGTILPRAILDRPGVIAAVGAGGAGRARRVLLDWGLDAENRSLGIWLDGDELTRVNPRRRPRALTVPEQHQLRIARASLRMPGPMLGVMGGPDPRQAARIVRQLGRGRRNQPFTVGAPEIQAFLAAWHEDGRADFERHYRNLDYDSPAYQHVARDRRKYIALDQGTGGVFLVDKVTGDVFTIKGYGVPNRRVGTLAQLTARYQAGQAPPRGLERYQGSNPRRRRTAGAWGSMGLVPRRRSRRPFRNPQAGFETFDLADRAGWERAIRTAGGLRVSKSERGELAEVPGHLKGYRRGVAPDELAQMIADERGLPARQVERAMLAAFHGPRRRATTLEDVDVERLEREAIQLEGRARGGESRPRVRVGFDAFTLRPRSPFKGSIHHVNPFLTLAAARALQRNPPRPRGTMIYDRLLELRARKGRRSHYPLELFKHGFKPGAQVIGLPSGDVLLHGARGQRLWQHVEV